MAFFGNFLLTTKESYSCRGTKHPSLRPQAQHLLAAARAFPHVTGVFLIVVAPPTVPTQLSAAAAAVACCGRNLSSTELQPSNIAYPVPNGHTYLCRRKAPKARFDNRHSISAPAPILSLHQRQRRKRYKRSLNRQCYPPHQFREASTAKFALTRPAPRDP